MQIIKIIFILFLVFDQCIIASKIVNNLHFINGITIPYYTDSEILDLEKELDINLPKLLKYIYTKKLSIEELFFLNDKNRNLNIEIIFDLYPKIPDSLNSNVKDFILRAKKDKYFIKPPNDSIAFAYDEFGDIVYVDKNSRILVYHHESDNFFIFTLKSPPAVKFV